MKNKDETRNYFPGEIQESKLMISKQKKVCTILSYADGIPILDIAVTRCVSILTFTSVISIPIGITSSSIGLTICRLTASTKKYNSTFEDEEEWEIGIATKN